MYKSMLKIGAFILFFVGIQLKTNAQKIISNIEIEGNAKTKSYIILRELPYRAGQVIPADSIVYFHKIAKQQLVNTSLFTDVQVISNELDSSQFNIKIVVKERWYIFPIPYFRWVDRNFSEWWNTRNHSLDRVNYGVNLRQSNTTGNNDRLTVGLITGYTHQAVIKYQLPFIDKKLKFGMGFGGQYFTQKELNTSTKADKQIFTKTENDISKGFRVNVNFSYRPNLYDRFNVQVGYGNSAISDTGLMIQPKYLPNHQKSFNYSDLTANFSTVKFDYNAYPTEGNSTEFGIYQRISSGSNISSFQFRKLHAHRFSTNNFYLFETNSLFKILSNQNYLDNKLLGYGNLQMNGFEYYVIDGNIGSIAKAEIHHLLGTYTLPRKYGIALLDKVNNKLPPIYYHFWVRAFTNLGYVYSERPSNASKLSNTLLRSFGVGLDIISIYDLVIKIDYSVNQLGDKGLYLHGGINF
jgi:outer membrane protein assembly factor BamA